MEKKRVKPLRKWCSGFPRFTGQVDTSEMKSKQSRRVRTSTLPRPPTILCDRMGSFLKKISVPREIEVAAPNEATIESYSIVILRLPRQTEELISVVKVQSQRYLSWAVRPSNISSITTEQKINNEHCFQAEKVKFRQRSFQSQSMFENNKQKVSLKYLFVISGGPYLPDCQKIILPLYILVLQADSRTPIRFP